MVVGHFATYMVALFVFLIVTSFVLLGSFFWVSMGISVFLILFLILYGIYLAINHGEKVSDINDGYTTPTGSPYRIKNKTPGAPVASSSSRTRINRFVFPLMTESTPPPKAGKSVCPDAPISKLKRRQSVAYTMTGESLFD